MKIFWFFALLCMSQSFIKPAVCPSGADSAGSRALVVASSAQAASRWSVPAYRKLLRGVPASEIPSYTKSVFDQVARLVEDAAVAAQLKVEPSQKTSFEKLKQDVLLGAMESIETLVNGLWNQKFKSELGAQNVLNYYALVKNCLDGYTGVAFTFQSSAEGTCHTTLTAVVGLRIRDQVARYKEEQRILKRYQDLEERHLALETELARRDQEVERLGLLRERGSSECASWCDKYLKQFDTVANEEFVQIEQSLVRLKERPVVAVWMRQMLTDGAMAEVNARDSQWGFDQMKAANLRHAAIRQQAGARTSERCVRAFMTNLLFKTKVFHEQLKMQWQAELPGVMQKIIDRQQVEIQQAVVVAAVAQAENTRLHAQVSAERLDIEQLLPLVSEALGGMRQTIRQQQADMDVQQRRAQEDSTAIAALQRESRRLQSQIGIAHRASRNNRPVSVPQALPVSVVALPQTFHAQCPSCLSTLSLQRCAQSCCPGGLAVMGSAAYQDVSPVSPYTPFAAVSDDRSYSRQQVVDTPTIGFRASAPRTVPFSHSPYSYSGSEQFAPHQD